MFYLDDVKKGVTVTLAELEEAEREWRGSVDSQLAYLDFPNGLPPLEEVEDMLQATKDAALDVVEWAKVAEALLHAREKAKAA
jgi:hypothetical protein